MKIEDPPTLTFAREWDTHLFYVGQVLEFTPRRPWYRRAWNSLLLTLKLRKPAPVIRVVDIDPEEGVITFG